MLKLAIIVLDGCWGSQLMGILDFVAIHSLVAAHHGVPPSLEVHLYGLTDGEVRLGNGLSLPVKALEEQPDPQTLALVPGVEYGQLKQLLDNPALDWARLGRFFRESQAVLGLSTGTFMLAQSGVLNGGQVVTHWRFAETLQRRYPQLTVSHQHSLLEWGRFASATQLDAALTWLAQRLLASLSSHVVSQSLALTSQNGEVNHTLWLAELHRYKQHADSAILELQYFIDANYAKPLTLAMLAARINASESSLKRRFRKACGLSASRYWQLVRMARMKHLLLTSDTPVDDLCCDIGYTDPRFARRLFAQSTGLSPRAFRQRAKTLAIPP